MADNMVYGLIMTFSIIIFYGLKIWYHENFYAKIMEKGEDRLDFLQMLFTYSPFPLFYSTDDSNAARFQKKGNLAVMLMFLMISIVLIVEYV